MSHLKELHRCFQNGYIKKTTIQLYQPAEGVEHKTKTIVINLRSLGSAIRFVEIVE